MRTEQQTEPMNELYESPDIEVMDIELGMNILAESGAGLNDMDGEKW